MKNLSFWMVSLGVCMAWGETYRMSTADSVGTSSFNAVGHWVNASGGAAAETAPAPGNDYVVSNGYMLRTPVEAGDVVFAGDSLTFSHVNSYLAFKGKNGATVRVDNLIFDGGYLQNATDQTQFYLDGRITILNDKGLRLQTVEPNWRRIVVRSSITGGGLLWCQTPKTNNAYDVNNKLIALEGDNSGFTGKIKVTGGGTFCVNSDKALGAVPETLVPDALTFCGDVWLVTNDLVVAATRGIVVSNITHVVPGAWDCVRPGLYIQSSGSPVGTLTINGPVSGDGPIIKTGDSGYLRFRGSLADFHGDMRLERGATYFDEAEPVSLPSISLAAGMALQSNTLTVARFTITKGNFWFYATGIADPSEPRLDVTESFTYAREENVTVKVFDLLEDKHGVPFALIRAPGTVLSEMVAKGWIYTEGTIYQYQLNVTDNGDGTETLWLTRTPADNLYFHAVSDAYNETSFTKAAWKTNGADTVAAAVAGNVYVQNSNVFRTPASGDGTFPGDVLYFPNNAGMTIKGSGTATFPQAICYGACVWNQSDPVRAHFAGNLRLLPVGDFALRINSASQKRTVDLLANLSGTGELQIRGEGNPAGQKTDYTIALLGDNSDFSGKIYVLGQTNFFCRILTEESLGSAPTRFTSNQLRFNGGGLMVTNSVTLDDSTRGIYLESTGGTCGVLNDDVPASYASTTPEADRKFLGDAWFNAVGTDSVLTINCPIAGTGMLSVYADGVVALGGANTYSGGTTVRRGTLRPLSAQALGKGALTVKDGATLYVPGEDVLPNGVEVSGTVTFEEGALLAAAAIDAALAEEKAHFQLPLFCVASADAVDADAVKAAVQRGLPKSWRVTLESESVTVGGAARTRLVADIRKAGFLIIVQ